MKPIRTWIVVADGARARVFENTGPGKGLEPLPGRVLETEVRPAREILADRPGRSFDRKGPGRHALEPTVDWHRFQKQEFARKLSERLDRAAQSDAFDRLILVAPPRSLGDLRASIGEAVRQRLVGELAKDLTRCTDRELPAHLADLIAL
jgi:protein required for attachment to host cells